MYIYKHSIINQLIASAGFKRMSVLIILYKLCEYICYNIMICIFIVMILMCFLLYRILKVLFWSLCF